MLTILLVGLLLVSLLVLQGVNIMATVDNLLAKAMSTSSDEEAIAAFKMARKKNGGASLKTDSQKPNPTMDAFHKLQKERDHYFKQAAKGYTEYCLLVEDYKQIRGMHSNKLQENTELKSTIRNLENEDARLNLKFWRVSFVIMTAVFAVFLGFTAFF